MVAWNVLASIATIIAAIVVVFAAYLTVRQLAEMTKSRHLEGMLKVYEMIGSDEARRSRRYIYEKLRSEPESVSESERSHIEEVSVLLDKIGALTESGLIPGALLFESHGVMIVRIWERLEPYILYYRQFRGPKYVRHFERLAVSAQRYETTHQAQIDKEGDRETATAISVTAQAPDS
jgi:hypothetical protein